MTPPSPAWAPVDRWSLDLEGIDLWRIPLVPGPADWDLLSADELARAQRLIIESKREQFVAGRARLRQILGRTLAVPPGEIRFAYEEHGKPYLPDAPQVAFNLSHSHELGLLAVTGEVRVGVDVEHRREGRQLLAIAERFFAPPEVQVFKAAPQERRNPAFYRAWAQKEAYLKAWGTGLTFSSQRFVVVMNPERAPAILSTEMAGDEPGRWRVEDVPAGDAYAAALCYEGEARATRYFDASRLATEG